MTFHHYFSPKDFALGKRTGKQNRSKHTCPTYAQIEYWTRAFALLAEGWRGFGGPCNSFSSHCEEIMFCRGRPLEASATLFTEGAETKEKSPDWRMGQYRSTTQSPSQVAQMRCVDEYCQGALNQRFFSTNILIRARSSSLSRRFLLFERSHVKQVMVDAVLEKGYSRAYFDCKRVIFTVICQVSTMQFSGSPT